MFYAENDTDKHPGNMSHGVETIKFFLNCISLLVGRLDKKQFENAVCESGLQTSNFLLSLLHCTDEDVIDGAVSILRALVFKPNFPLIKSSHLDLQQMESVFPLLLNLLDERDSIAKAVVLLTAEFCFLNPDGQCLKEIFIRLDSGNRCQGWNAIDVILELIHVSSDSGNAFPLSVRDMQADLIVLKGEKVWNLSMKESYHLKEGDFLFTPAGDVHRVRYFEDTEFFIRWDGQWDIFLDEDLDAADAAIEKEKESA